MPANAINQHYLPTKNVPMTLKQY